MNKSKVVLPTNEATLAKNYELSASPEYVVLIKMKAWESNKRKLIIANDILNYIEEHKIQFWTTRYMKHRKIKSSLPEIGVYKSPQLLSQGIRHLHEEGYLEKVSNKRYKINENLLRRRE